MTGKVIACCDKCGLYDGLHLQTCPDYKSDDGTVVVEFK